MSAIELDELLRELNGPDEADRLYAVHDLMDDEAEWVRDPGFYQSFGETLTPPTNERWAA